MKLEIRNYLKNKIETQLIKNGGKSIAEKILRKSIKNMQINTNKPSKVLLKLALISATQFYKIHKFEQKKGRRKKIKEIPGFIFLKSSRNSLAIKNILIETKKNKKKYMFLELEKICLNQAKNFKIDKSFDKNNLNEQVHKLNHLFKYFKLH